MPDSFYGCTGLIKRRYLNICGELAGPDNRNRRDRKTTPKVNNFHKGDSQMPRRERYLRTSEVAHQLQVSPKTVARWAKEGRLPYLATLGGHRRFPESVIQQVLENLSSLHPYVSERG